MLEVLRSYTHWGGIAVHYSSLILSLTSNVQLEIVVVIENERLAIFLVTFGSSLSVLRDNSKERGVYDYDNWICTTWRYCVE